jgi:4-amino-4-deoxy-L-arabinose transferase-like glycosyltransferase
VLPLLVVAVDRLAARDPRGLLWLRPAWGLPLALAVPLAWMLAAAALRPGYRPLSVLDRHVVSRFGEGLHHARPFWYYGVHFFVELAPWSFLVPAAAVVGWRRHRFLVLWLLTILAFFSISSEKRGLYILPAAPAAALLVGDLWRRWKLREERLPRRLTAAGLALTGLVLCGAAALPAALARRGGPEAAALAVPARALAVAGLAGGLAVLIALSRRRLAGAMTALAAGSLAVMLVYAHGVQPAMDPFKSARELGAAIARRAGPGSEVGMLGFRAAYVYYSGVRLEELGSLQAAADWISRPGRLLLLEADAWDELRPGLTAVREVARDGVGHRSMVLVERDG